MRTPLVDRFWPKVRKSDGCWLWTGAIDTTGYGVINGGPNRKLYAHRVSAEIAFGPAEPGRDTMHSCDVRACVNPDHLSYGTRRDNVRDAREKGKLRGRYSGMTECVHGHAFDSANTRIRPNGSRACRTCAREIMRRRRAAA